MSEKHHSVRNFSDISEINEINILSQVQFDNLLSENQTFNSKEHLQYTTNEYHIKRNIDLKIENNSKSKLIMVCTKMLLEIIRCMSTTLAWGPCIEAF
jgi:hypothetical protein